MRHLSICVPKQMPQRGRNRHPARVSVSPSDHGKIFCQRKKFFVNTINNQIARPKTTLFGKRTLVGAVGYVLALPQSGNARVCAPLLLFPKISQCVSTLRFSGTRLIIKLRVPKPRFSECALSSEQSATFSHCRKAAMLACALRSSSSQKSRSALARCDFREHV